VRCGNAFGFQPPTGTIYFVYDLLSDVSGRFVSWLNNYNLSEQIRDCLRHAEDCARKAAAQTDPELKQDFLVMEPLGVLSEQLRFHRTAHQTLKRDKPASG
jgi:hypothetical protein